MSTIIQEPEADVVTLGMGAMSGVVGTELAIAGYQVVGIDKGPFWDYANDFATTKYDEWGIMTFRKFDHPLPLSTVTLRNSTGQMAMPIRRYTPTKQYTALGHGVGGAQQHYGGQMGRQGPGWYQVYSETVSKYGLAFLENANPKNDVIDWPMTYYDYEPYYVEWEKAWGLTGTNQGPLIPMSQNYPLPPHPITPLGQMFQSATEAMGYHPYPHVTALASQAYVNQYGVQVNACVYDGWCAANCNYPCETGAKANSAFRAIPAAIKTGNFTPAVNSYIFRLDTDPSTGNITAARYYDSAGNIHVQPGKVFFNGLWGYNIARMMLLSGVGSPYNPATVSGTMGRGLTAYTPGGVASVSGTINVGANAYPAGNGFGGGMTIYDFMDDNFDHTGLNFIGGDEVTVGTYAGAGPDNVQFADGTTATSVGSTYKATLKDRYLRTTSNVGGSFPAVDLAETDKFIDLDPHYTDLYGDPLPRQTFYWSNNCYNAAAYLAPVIAPIFTKMGAQNVKVTPGGPVGSSSEDSWGHHQRGGVRLGLDPSTSVLNQWQQCWTCENIFAAGEICNSVGDQVPSGTHVAGPQSYVAAEGIKKYLQAPGSLV